MRTPGRGILEKSTHHLQQQSLRLELRIEGLEGAAGNWPGEVEHLFRMGN